MSSVSLCAFIFAWLLTQLCSAGIGPPRIVFPIKSRQFIREGKTVKIICPVTADPPPLLLQWSKDKELIHAGWERFKMTKNFLKIQDVMKEDAGNYICKATNGFGSRMVNITLVVMEFRNESFTGTDMYSEFGHGHHTGTVPKFSQPSKMRRKNIQRPVGSSVRFKCKASGKPRPTILWYKDSKELTEEDIGHAKKTRWTLKLRNLKKEDSGKYTCKVTNQVGMINYTYELDVIDKIKEKPELIPPHPLNTTVRHGGTASFQCKVRSDVQPHIQWLKRVENPEALKNTNTTIEVKGQKFIVLKTGKVWPRPDGSYINKLIIKGATVKDSGMYICLGANSMGYSFRSAFLTVVPDPNAPNQVIKENVVISQTPPRQAPSLPLIIALPASVIIILVAIAIYILQRKKKCNNPNTTLRQHKLDKHQFMPLPQNGNTMQDSNEKIVARTSPQDVYSDLSSLPRVHQHQHQHMHYGC
ncbi:fibroblast growth factor receptor-like 1 [Lingula anatina]|uniref:receptor protein-tyrosine kinase n=1 Tax=Lingula anatina TaxID=7574 RepID=A0A1S3I6G4_LINAN|nr:fibroblast growth factor receptor-like 1 [Lingula anatina]XP_013392959.1 fibroblast growth factor receptor-like 1 [Lingula anatina]XP_013392960.1 fibroblast growth factor receptor-like 1 [Lingula anatina]XP_013392962.1 fibroblast growth factor receptor-like 1 [Lingula anatina]XP_013392963.1 fibroblast growth factor receptor-like 1 [Lingula anatina]XP_013392964.1 fibroblast growth factor receptor-like 1 [Lingula anatina]XP_013392965.1 fibroblast growth factor receptor-like 1 [Lingula anatin|eukprot:XP_013392958.1 fibroblast growth factor receptor-like 1 [Lingula anatina]